MSSRLALESWQLLFPAIGIGIFAAVFFAVVIRVWRMQPPAVDHLENLPLAGESRRSRDGLRETRSPARERRDPNGNDPTNHTP